MTSAYISLGSNMDNPQQQLAAAREALIALPDVHSAEFSPVYKTEPQGVKEQPWFYNQAARLLCGPSWSALSLLEALLAMEVALGRQRTGEKRFGPRRIDLDLLLFGSEQCKNELLCLPHPRMFERAFVLLPLQDIAPELIFPDGGNVKSRLAALSCRLQAGCILQ
jgi:2-amino-4-hydroxy-6-hydroxymethyldihydropteridine diphosphokinase